MPLTPVPSFSDALALEASRQHQQRWQAAQAVRARVAPGEQRDDLLSCLGLADVVAPDA